MAKGAWMSGLSARSANALNNTPAAFGIFELPIRSQKMHTTLLLLSGYLCKQRGIGKGVILELSEWCGLKIENIRKANYAKVINGEWVFDVVSITHKPRAQKSLWRNIIDPNQIAKFRKLRAKKGAS